MNKIGHAYKILAGWLLLSTVAFGVYFFLFFEVKKRNEIVSSLQDSLAVELERDLRLKSTETLVRETVRERAVIDAYFLSEEDAIIFLTEVEELSRTAHVSAEIASVDDVLASETQPAALSLHITGSGLWADIENFVELLETMPRAVEIESFNIRVEEAGSWHFELALRALKQS